MAALLMNLRAGDEVIVPSFAFPSTASAFALRGATPVFVDIRSDTLNLDETKVRAAITPRTRAIIPVHYGGVGCEMDELLTMAREHGLFVVEDAAHALLANYRERPLGSFGSLGAISFHVTKNIGAGEGGVLLVNDERFVEASEVIHCVGTNRRAFIAGEVRVYQWMDRGSSFGPSELTAALLLAQLEEADCAQVARHQLWQQYYGILETAETNGLLRRPCVPLQAESNCHIFHILLPALCDRRAVLRDLAAADIGAASHYEPLHNSPAGIRYGRAHGDLAVTREVAASIIRLPLWVGMSESDVEYVVNHLEKSLRQRTSQSSTAKPKPVRP